MFNTTRIKHTSFIKNANLQGKGNFMLFFKRIFNDSNHLRVWRDILQSNTSLYIECIR